MRLRKLSIPVLAFVAGAVVVPSVAYAATGSFSSASTTPAVKATNSTSGLAIDASSKGTVFRSTSSGTSNGTALWLKQYSSGAKSNGLFAKYYGPNNGVEHYGVYGVNSSDIGAGVLGEGNSSPDAIGVQGVAAGGIGVYGSGAGWGVVSDGDFGTNGNVYDAAGGWAGTCAVSAGSGTCTFKVPFADTSAVPVVVLTPQSDPGGTYWVSAADANGFTVSRAAGAAGTVTFGYQVVGTYPGQALAASAEGGSTGAWTARK